MNLHIQRQWIVLLALCLGGCFRIFNMLPEKSDAADFDFDIDAGGDDTVYNIIGDNTVYDADGDDTVYIADGDDTTQDDDGDDTVQDPGGDEMNLLLSENGGVMTHFTSAYCDPPIHEGECEPGIWIPENIHDGEFTAGAACPDQFRAAWASAWKYEIVGPEVFEFEFGGGGARALISSIVVENTGTEGCYDRWVYYSGDIEVQADGVVIVHEHLAEDTSLQEFTFPPIEVETLRFSVLSACDSRFCDGEVWQIGEIEVWGVLLD